LKDVENYIKQNGHLKDIPSAKEIGQTGFFLAEKDAKLMQKIEELTLYKIRRLKTLFDRVSIIKKKLDGKN